MKISWCTFWKVCGITALSLTLLAGNACAVPIEEWNKTFGGAGDDRAYSVEQTKDGGFIVAGYTTSYGAGMEDAWLIKTDGTGNEIWNRTFGGARSEKASYVWQTSEGGYILAGETNSFRRGSNAWLIKTDANGNEQWNMTYEGERASSVQQTSDGGYIIAGGAIYLPTNLPAMWIAKTDAGGNEQWNRTFTGGKLDFANSAQQTSDRGYIVAGDIYGVQGPIPRLIKTDANGNQQLSREFVRKSNRTEVLYDYESGQANSVQQTADGGYIIAGYTNSHSSGGYKIILSNFEVVMIKTDKNGNEQWNKTFGEDYEDEASSVWQAADGGYIISGSKCLIRAGQCDEWLDSKCIEGPKQCDAWLIRTDANGNEQWNKTLGGTEEERAYQVQQTRDGGYILAGYTFSYGAAGSNAWLIKVSREPAPSLEKASGFEIVLAIAILMAVYIAGRGRR